jgi:ComEC/Rec2-related protein
MLKALQSPRVLAHVRNRYPLLLPTLGLLIGQLSVAALGWQVALILSCGFIWLSKRCLRNYAIGLVLGFALGAVTMGLELGPAIRLPEHFSAVYLAKVDTEPRYTEPGVEVLGLSLYQAANGAAQGSFTRSFRALCRASDLPWVNSSRLKAGSVFALKANFQAVLDTGLGSYESMLRRRGYDATCKFMYSTKPIAATRDWQAQIRGSFFDYLTGLLGDSEDLRLFLSMVFGVRETLSRKTEQAFKQAGLAHLLVVSGYQVTLVFYAVYLLAYMLLVQSRILAQLLPLRALAAFFGFISACLYVFMCGLEGSTMRAALAVGLMMLARSMERGRGLLHPMVISFLLLNMIWPGCFLEPGVQLTYAALGGILLGVTAFRSSFGRFLGSCFYASLCTALVTLYWFGSFSLYGILLNPILAALISALSCKLGLLAVALHLAGLDMHAYGLRAMVAGTGYFRQLVEVLASVPGCYWAPQGLSCFSLMLVLACFLARSFSFQVASYFLANNLVPRLVEREAGKWSKFSFLRPWLQVLLNARFCGRRCDDAKCP